MGVIVNRAKKALREAELSLVAARLLEQEKPSPTHLARALGLAKFTVQKWISGTNLPNGENSKAIIKLFGGAASMPLSGRE